MPQLTKGGKYVFGWSVVSKDGKIPIPEEARREYQLKSGERVILIPGSNTSGGFSIAKKLRLEQSKLSDILTRNPELAKFRTEEGETININGRNLCWVTIEKGGLLQLPPHTLEVYGVMPGDYLLAVRGSYIGIGMVVRGRLIEEARKHPEIAVFKFEAA
jgi:bifunctional DNA-binding transcriptional regulator/antitoxin component of YhaV-PrlF toxin-antitoxin module